MRRIILIVGLIVLALVATQIIRYPTYEYDGQVLAADEFLELVEAQTPLICTPLPIASHLLDRGGFYNVICFNTQAEMDAYLASAD